MAYKRKKTSEVVSSKTKGKSARLNAVESPSPEMIETVVTEMEIESTAPVAGLTAIPAEVTVGPEGGVAHVELAGATAVEAEYDNNGHIPTGDAIFSNPEDGTTSWSFAGAATAVYSGFIGNPDGRYEFSGLMYSGTSGEDGYSVFSGDCVNIFTEEGKEAVFNAGYFSGDAIGRPGEWVEAEENAIRMCLTYDDPDGGYTGSASTYSLYVKDGFPAHDTYSGSADPSLQDSTSMDIEVAPVEGTHPTYIAGDQKKGTSPVYTGYFNVDAQAIASEFSGSTVYDTLDTVIPVDHYSDTVGYVTLTAGDQMTMVTVKQNLTINTGRVTPLHISSTSDAAAAPVTILPAEPVVTISGKDTSSYHIADDDTWTVSPNCDWVHFYAAAELYSGKYVPASKDYYSGATKLVSRTPVGYGVVSHATIPQSFIDDGFFSNVPSGTLEREQAKQKVQFFLTLDANTTGKYREAYPTVSVGTEIHKITIRQDA